MNLKLAEYNLKDGKFLRFLELGKKQGLTFLYGNEYLKIQKYGDPPNYSPGYISAEFEVEKDKTDPLNRFNGRFNNRSFGGGKFVLEINEQDTYAKWGGKFYTLSDFTVDKTRLTVWDEKTNLHESPELFKELNNE